MIDREHSGLERVVPLSCRCALRWERSRGTARADDSPVRGDLIAYSCKEPGNTWYAICVMKSDGSEKQRMTSRLTTTNPAWSPDGRRIAFTRNEDVGSRRRSPTTTVRDGRRR